MPYDKIAKNYTTNLAASMKQTTETILADAFSKEYLKYRIEHGAKFMDTAVHLHLKEQPLQTLCDLWLVGVGESVSRAEMLNRIENNDYMEKVGQYLYEAGALRLNPVTQTYYLIPLRSPTPCKS
jgi:hypothetical protein